MIHRILLIICNCLGSVGGMFISDREFGEKEKKRQDKLRKSRLKRRLNIK